MNSFTIGIRRSGYKSQIKERPRNAHDDCASSSAGTELSSVKCWLSSATTSSWRDLGDNALFQDISFRSEFLLLIQVHSHLVSAPVDQLPSVVELSWSLWCFSWSIAVQFNQWPRLPCTIFHRDFLDPCGGLFSSRSWGLKLFWCPAWTLCLYLIYLGKIFSVDISSPWVSRVDQEKRSFDSNDSKTRIWHEGIESLWSNQTVTVLKVEASAMLEQCRKQEPILAGFPANSLEGLETFELSESWEVLAAEVWPKLVRILQECGFWILLDPFGASCVCHCPAQTWPLLLKTGSARF